jgi:hypothetical protein
MHCTTGDYWSSYVFGIGIGGVRMRRKITPFFYRFCFPADFSCRIALMMEVASTSETSVNFYQTTRRNIPEY